MIYRPMNPVAPVTATCMSNSQVLVCFFARQHNESDPNHHCNSRLETHLRRGLTKAVMVSMLQKSTSGKRKRGKSLASCGSEDFHWAQGGAVSTIVGRPDNSRYPPDSRQQPGRSAILHSWFRNSPPQGNLRTLTRRTTPDLCPAVQGGFNAPESHQLCLPF